MGIDIGGTKVKAGVVEVGLSAGVIASQEIPTPRAGPPGFYDAVAVLARRVRTQAEGDGRLLLPLVAVAQPGRFLPDGTLARGTTPNLGTAPGQFDGLHPSQELERRLSGTVIAENDAVAQMRFGLAALLDDPAVRPQLLGRAVVYLGPGTGMGGGVARVSRAGMVSTLTDGHLFDMQISGYGDGTLTAEELFTGPAIAREIARRDTRLPTPIEPASAEGLDRILLNPGAPDDERREAERIADGFGEILAALIETIHAGAITKVRLERSPDGRLLRHVNEPDRAWSGDDRAAVRGASRFILGGSVGCSAGLGRRIRERALERLREQGRGDLLIVQIPVVSADAGLLGAVLGLPASVIQNALSVSQSAGGG